LWSPAKGSQFDDWDTFDGLLLSRLVLHTTTRLARSKSQTEIPHRRKGHEQQRWPTAGSNPCSGLFRGWYGAEVASLSSMKIVLANETEKFGDHCRLVKIEQAEDTFETSGCAEQDPKNFLSMGHRHHTMQIPQYTRKPHVNQPPSLSEGGMLFRRSRRRRYAHHVLGEIHVVLPSLALRDLPNISIVTTPEVVVSTKWKPVMSDYS